MNGNTFVYQLTNVAKRSTP